MLNQYPIIELRLAKLACFAQVLKHTATKCHLLKSDHSDEIVILIDNCVNNIAQHCYMHIFQILIFNNV